MPDPTPPHGLSVWLDAHINELVAYLFGASGIAWNLWDRFRQRKKDDLDETKELSSEWRLIRTELREEIEKFRARVADQEKAIDAQRTRIYQLEADNRTLHETNREQAEEINRLEGLLGRLDPPKVTTIV